MKERRRKIKKLLIVTSTSEKKRKKNRNICNMTVGLDFFLFQRNEEKKQKRKENERHRLSNGFVVVKVICFHR